mmetsp:Transcript_2359/g.3201  ORF Transcript_2359/g.3201 Transcript_2359/m.3201 type:complete len:431 (+) Transcript_2359:31-1323(+)
MASSSPAETTVFSFVTKREDRKSIELLQTTASDSKGNKNDEDDIKFKILKGSLTANNKFYLDFGEKPPFHFFKCYPIVPEQSSLVSSSSKSNDDVVNNENYAHPCVWGIAQVTESRLDNVQVGTKYIAMLPIGESVSFRTARVDTEDDYVLIVDRPTTNPAYNVFRKVDDEDDERYEDLALACSPGIMTGFGLNFHLRNCDFYGADAVVVTSASSKVALALAVYLKHNNNPVTKKIIGYTSESNKEFCRKTGLYDEIIGYEDALNFEWRTKKTKYVIVDIAGRGEVYNRNIQEPDVEIVKLLAIGNASGTANKQSTFASFSMIAKVKLMLTMVGAPAMFSSWMNPVQELYLIFNGMADLKKEWGAEKLRATLNEYERIFCKAATDEEWISIRTCDTEESIQKAFAEIVQGTVHPSETIILDVVKAVAHRK